MSQGAKIAVLAGATLFLLLTVIAAAAAAVITLLTGGLLAPGSSGPAVTEFSGYVTCKAAGGVHGDGLDLDAAQAENAAVIHQVALDSALPAQADVIALAAAMQESDLYNLDHGDRDSLGLFQQRPSQGWGTPAQIMNPAYAATQFFRHLQRVPGWWQLPLGQAADAVQHSGYPTAYQAWQHDATDLDHFLESTPGACSSSEST